MLGVSVSVVCVTLLRVCFCESVSLSPCAYVRLRIFLLNRKQNPQRGECQYLHASACTNICMYTLMCAFKHICMPLCVCMRVCMRMCVFAYLCT